MKRHIARWLAVITLAAGLGAVAAAPNAMAESLQCSPVRDANSPYLAGYQTGACAYWSAVGSGSWHVSSVYVYRFDSDTSKSTPFWSDVQYSPGTPTYYKYMGKSTMRIGDGMWWHQIDYSHTVPNNRALRFSVQAYTADGDYRCTMFYWINRDTWSYKSGGCELR